MGGEICIRSFFWAEMARKTHLSGILSENSVSGPTVSTPVLGEMLRMDDMFDWKTLIDNLILNIRTFPLDIKQIWSNKYIKYLNMSESL